MKTVTTALRGVLYAALNAPFVSSPNLEEGGTTVCTVIVSRPANGGAIEVPATVPEGAVQRETGGAGRNREHIPLWRVVYSVNITAARHVIQEFILEAHTRAAWQAVSAPPINTRLTWSGLHPVGKAPDRQSCGS
jgi:hypothetical protein